MHKRKGTQPTRATPGGYLLPEDAHLALLQTRDQLRLLALLADPRGSDEPELRLSSGALAECFWRLAGDLDGVARAAVWPAVAMPERAQ
jgi:hypothetical protein